MSSKNPLVTNKENIVKEGINDMGKKHNTMKESITPPIAKKNIDTVNKTEKSQAPKTKYSSNKSDKDESLDK